MKEEDEDCEIQKPQIRHYEDEDQMQDLEVKKILISDLHMPNKFRNSNCKSARFGMQRFKDDMLEISTASIKVFAQSSKIFTQTSDLLEQSIEKLVQSTNELTQSNEWA